MTAVELSDESTSVAEVRRRGSRQVLLDAAAALMSERSGIEVSLSEIARRAELNAALVKYYFGSKRGLYRELALSLVQSGMAQLDTLLTAPMSPADKLKVHIRGVVRLYFRYPFLNRLIHAMLEDAEEAREVAEKVTKPLADLQMQLLEQGVEQGCFRAVDSMLFYFIVLGACDQIFFARNTLRHGFGVENITDELQRQYANLIADLVLKGVQVSAAENC